MSLAMSYPPRQGVGLASMRRVLDVILHVGAHRTGTTTLQQTLHHNHQRLKAHKVEYWAPQMIRAGLFDGLIKAADRVSPQVIAQARTANQRIARDLHRLDAAGTRTLIVSEENMLGSIPASVTTERLYPDAARRVARLRPAFARHCTRIGLAIRSYDQLWTSMISFTVKRSGRVPDADQRAGLVAQPRRWRDIIRELRVVFPRAEILVWPFEGMVDAPHDVIARMTGRDLALPLEPVEVVHNPAPDIHALRAAVEAGSCAGHLARLAEWNSGRWMPFTEPQRTKMRADYAEDIAWLRSNPGPAIRYIESPEDIAGPTEEERGVRHDEGQRRVG